jgi:CxxC motif-containing protein
MNDRMVCVLCPAGCELEVEAEGGKVRVSGQQCEKGVDFAVRESLYPTRNLATAVPARSSPPGGPDRMVPVRLTAAIPRETMARVLAEIAKLRPELPVRRGQVLIPDVLGTGADVIVTRTIDG